MDWVSATVRGVFPSQLAERFGTPDDSWVETHGLNGYSASLLGAGGFRICYTPGREDVHIIAPGQRLNLVSVPGQRELLRSLTACGANFTRIDLQLTDLRPVATPRDVWDALERGEGVTRVKSWRWVQEGGNKHGSSVYVGSKSSQQRLLVYDKDAESGGAVPGIRWELRMYDAAAETVVPQLLDAPDWGPVWASRLLAFVDFRECVDGANSARRPRLPWFGELVQGAEKMRAYPPRPIRTLEGTKRWVEKQVAPSLALIYEAADGDIESIMQIVEGGQPRMRPSHWAMLDADREQGA